jgi:hypothetical protein
LSQDVQKAPKTFLNPFFKQRLLQAKSFLLSGKEI